MNDTLSAVRSFNRFYTQFVGALDAEFLGTQLSLPEARVLFEVAHASDVTASELQSALAMDAGYMSRIVSRFEKRGWIRRGRAKGDGRRRPIALTGPGREAFDLVDSRQRMKVEQIVSRLSAQEQDELVSALQAARSLLAGPSPSAPQLASFTLRPFRPGDMGMIAARQSMLYRSTYGWGPQIEVNIGEVTASFLNDFKDGREQCWVAELNDTMVGSIFLTDEGGGLSRLRLLYVEPFARGLGVGNALVTACVGFARDRGYDTITLWTHTILESARRIYAAHGFKVIDVHVHELFGSPLQSETWTLDLA